MVKRLDEGMLSRPAQITRSCQAGAEHFQQCAEFLPLRNRGLGAFAVPDVPINRRLD